MVMLQVKKTIAKSCKCSRSLKKCCSDTRPRETSIRKNCPHVSTLGDFFSLLRHFFQNAPSHHSSWSSSPSQVPEGCLSSLPQPSQPNPPNLQLHLTARCQGLLQFSFLLGMQRRKASCLKRLQLETTRQLGASAHVFWWMVGNFKSKMEDCTYKNGLLQEALMNFDPVNIDTSPVEKAGFMLEKPQKLGQTLPPRASAHASCSTKKKLPGHHLNHRNDSTKSGAELQNLDILARPSSISYLVEGYWHILELDVVTSRQSNSETVRQTAFFRWDRVPWWILVSYKNNPTIHCINTSDWIILWISRVKKEASKYLTWHTRVVRFDLKDIPKILDQDTQLRCVVRDLAGGP